jgi:cardiolipin synthase A/B
MSGRPHDDENDGDAPRDRYEVLTAEHRLHLFAETAAFWAEVEAGIERARSTVWLSTFIYHSDRLGRQFGERLARAAARGVDVRLMYDSRGSADADPALFEQLAARGVRVKCYRPWRAARFWRYFPRDHGRLLVIDDAAYTGGINWRDDWLPAERGGGGWHDVAVGVVGPCVADFRSAYEVRWREADSLGATADHITQPADAEVALLADSPHTRPVIFEQLCERTARAQRRIWIENSYCVPPRQLLDALCAAAARGVDVKLLQPAHTDLAIVQTITRGEYRAWLKRGLYVFEYEPTVLHAKFALIDDDWGTVGSFNAIAPGLWWANETNLVVRHAGFASALARIFEGDLRRAVRVDDGWLRQNPWLIRAWRAFAATIFRLLERLDVVFGPARSAKRP